MKLLPVLSEGWDAVWEAKETMVCNIQANMTNFPLCCSTGILKNVTAQFPRESDKVTYENAEPITGIDEATIKSAKYCHDVIRACNKASRPIYLPIEAAIWNAMSLCLRKAVDGTDDGGNPGYANYKAAQITMFDRMLDDKRDQKFAFGSYNIVFSIDQFNTWLDEQDGKYGDFYLSPPVPGGHGARVRGSIFTPDHAACKAFNDEKLALLKEHVIGYLNAPTKSVVQKAVDAVAAKW